MTPEEIEELERLCIKHDAAFNTNAAVLVRKWRADRQQMVDQLADLDDKLTSRESKYIDTVLEHQAMQERIKALEALLAQILEPESGLEGELRDTARTLILEKVDHASLE